MDDMCGCDHADADAAAATMGRRAVSSSIPTLRRARRSPFRPCSSSTSAAASVFSSVASPRSVPVGVETAGGVVDAGASVGAATGAYNASIMHRVQPPRLFTVTVKADASVTDLAIRFSVPPQQVLDHWVTTASPCTPAAAAAAREHEAAAAASAWPQPHVSSMVVPSGRDGRVGGEKEADGWLPRWPRWWRPAERRWG